jgi:hypothetical protein
MSIKLAVLKSGEDVIADVKELVMKERVVGYTFNNPATIRFLDPESIYFPDKNIDIVFAPWIPLSAQKEVPVAPDWIITLVDPIPQVVEKYKEGLKNGKANQGFDSNEQLNSDLAADGSEC